MTNRTAPLTAHHARDDVAAEAVDLEPSVVLAPDDLPTEADRTRRDQRFDDGVRTLRVGGANVVLSERILLFMAGVIAPLGLVLVLLGYLGASQTPYVFEQVSYLISGGLFGLALVFLGAFFYFAHWLTQLVKEHRTQSTAMLEAIRRLQDEVAQIGGAPVLVASANGHRTGDDDARVATARGTMAHRADCVVVAGKADLRPVTPADGLRTCKLCEPA